jgi:glycosyltransferase involved in cell wall biosynthesis
MEERKGVHIIIEAANELIRTRGRKDVHFLFLGNENSQEKRFGKRYLGTETEKFITFGGYRGDINQIHPSCYLGVIASTGWDSLTMSAVEIACSGLPLIVSNLQGLGETVEDGKTGYLFPAGDHIALADKIERLLDNPGLQNELGSNARRRVIVMFSKRTHIDTLVTTMSRLYLKAVTKST